MSPLAALVAAAPGSLVLPPGERRAHVDVPEPLRLLGSADLGDGRHLAVVEDAARSRWTVPLVFDGDGVRRAVPGDGAAEALVRGLLDLDRVRRDGAAPSTAPGAALEGSGPFVADAWYAEELAGERGITADQTNESVIVGGRAMVKWAVHLPRAGVRGAQPAGERLAALMAAGFDETPQPWGLVRWTDHEDRGPGGSPAVLLASVTAYLDGAQDGWDWAVDDVGRAARHELPLDDALAPPRRLGMLVARMHVALAGAGVVAATHDDLARWRVRAKADLDEALRVVGGDEGRRLHAKVRRIRTACDVALGSVGTPLIAVHGDLHVGQVLRRPHPDPTLAWEYAVTDFDGNPVLPPEARSLPQPAALDVAGMMASLDHVGRVVLRRTEGADPEIVRAWIATAQEDFLHEYVDTLARLRHGHLLDQRLLPALRAIQEVREFLYAVRHLPHWVYVPDAALADLFPEPE